MYEQQRDQLSAQQFNVDQTSFAIDTIKSTQTTVSAMKAAAKTMKKEAKKINLNEIENMQDDIEDMLEDVGEISEILGRSYGTPDGVEEEDLDAELACLEEEWANEPEIAESDAAASSEPSYSLPQGAMGLPAPPPQHSLLSSSSTNPNAISANAPPSYI
jgi:charged multivesicular body protein 5